jgi:Cu(I)/Ag(I) efflux system periplasmic protein CusF
MQTLFTTIIAALLATSIAPAALAQTHAVAPKATAEAQPNGPSAPTQAEPAESMEMVAAEVRKVDKDGGKVTLKHGAIKSLDMPAMTMVFRVKDPALFEKLIEGASVKAAFESKDGNYYVTKVETVKN